MIQTRTDLLTWPEHITDIPVPVNMATDFQILVPDIVILDFCILFSSLYQWPLKWPVKNNIWGMASALYFIGFEALSYFVLDLGLASMGLDFVSLSGQFF